MLEKVDLDKKMSKKEMKEILETESEKLALLQRKCKAAGIPIMVNKSTVPIAQRTSLHRKRNEAAD